MNKFVSILLIINMYFKLCLSLMCTSKLLQNVYFMHTGETDVKEGLIVNVYFKTSPKWTELTKFFKSIHRLVIHLVSFTQMWGRWGDMDLTFTRSSCLQEGQMSRWQTLLTYYFIFFFIYRSVLSYCYPKNNDVLTMEPNLHIIGLYSWAWICTCWSTQVSSCGWGCHEKFWWKRDTVSCLNVMISLIL